MQGNFIALGSRPIAGHGHVNGNGSRRVHNGKQRKKGGKKEIHRAKVRFMPLSGKHNR